MGAAAAGISVRVVLIAEMLLLVAVNDNGHVPAGADTRGTRGEAKRQIARATAETPFAPGVAKIIDELIAAVAVTVITVTPS